MTPIRSHAAKYNDYVRHFLLHESSGPLLSQLEGLQLHSRNSSVFVSNSTRVNGHLYLMHRYGSDSSNTLLGYSGVVAVGRSLQGGHSIESSA
jgi:hypothetical protein